MAFEVPPLPYDYNALEKSIDEQTMRLHHDKHHGAYVTNLNAALEKHPDWQKRSVEQVLRHINEVPEDVRTAVRNNGGGHANHSMFWRIMAPSGGWLIVVASLTAENRFPLFCAMLEAGE